MRGTPGAGGLIDWTAIGALATVAACILAYYQWRHGNKEKRKAPTKVGYRIVHSRLGLKTPKWEQSSEYPIISRFLRHIERIEHLSIYLWNNNPQSIKDFKIELSAFDFSLGNLEFATSLGETACKFRIEKGNKLIIGLEDLPAYEKLRISIVGSVVGVNIKLLNSNAQLIQQRDHFEWKKW